MLDFKQLQSDWGFMVYVTQIYPAMKPYLKGFHLSLESWQGGQDAEGWKRPVKETKEDVQGTKLDNREEKDEDGGPGLNQMEDIKEELLKQMLVGETDDTRVNGPPSGVTESVPRFKSTIATGPE
jgi:hypothetical protein